MSRSPSPGVLVPVRIPESESRRERRARPACADLPTEPPDAKGEATALLDDVARLLDELSASWQPSGTLLSSRRWHRMRWDQELSLVPLDAETETPLGPEFVVRCRDISRGGIAFVHDDPLPYRKVALLVAPPSMRGPATNPEWPRATIDDSVDGTEHATVLPCDVLIVRLSWCRFTRGGRYHSGGPFLRRESWPADRVAR